jgi:membrane protein implicated in regulation of membrane protease activity
MAALAVAPAGMIAATIFSVLGLSALLAWGMWRTSRKVERAERDLRYLRRILLRGGLVYACGAVIATVLVLTGHQPKESLLGLPIAALLCWTYFRAAIRVKVPPTNGTS